VADGRDLGCADASSTVFAIVTGPRVRREQLPTRKCAFPKRTFLHRDLLARTRLDARARALFGPDEVIATFDAVTGHPRLEAVSAALLPMAGAGSLYAAGQFARFASGHTGAGWQLLGPVIICVDGLCGAGSYIYCRLQGSRRVMFAVTSRGTVECAVDWLRRPCDVLHRAAVGAPTVLTRQQRGFCLVAIGGSQVWVSKEADPVIAWMSGADGA
jgi:hypothetical protein